MLILDYVVMEWWSFYQHFCCRDLIEAVKKQQKNLLTTNMEEYHKNCEQVSGFVNFNTFINVIFVTLISKIC